MTLNSRIAEGLGASGLDDFCERNGIGRTTAYREINSGRLPTRKIGKRTIVTHEDERRWLASLPPGGPIAAVSGRNSKRKKRKGTPMR